MGNTDFTGHRLAATLEWVVDHNKALTIQVTDSINGYNNGGDRNAARVEGDEWLRDQATVLAQVDYRLVRWDDVLAHPDFPKNQAKVHLLYENHQPFAAAVNGFADSYVARNPSRSRQASIDFILEEAAGYIPTWQGEPHIKLYPSRQPDWWGIAKTHLAGDTPAEYWAHLRFK
jgi:hypothetical protein